MDYVVVGYVNIWKRVATVIALEHEFKPTYCMVYSTVGEQRISCQIPPQGCAQQTTWYIISPTLVLYVPVVPIEPEPSTRLHGSMTFGHHSQIQVTQVLRSVYVVAHSMCRHTKYVYDRERTTEEQPTGFSILLQRIGRWQRTKAGQ